MTSEKEWSLLFEINPRADKVNRIPMKNMFRRKNSKNGFTLAEVLATVAIILILAGVTFVSVVQYQKNLRLMEMDGTAKEIFVAAQNHLSLAKASGDLDRLAEEANKTTAGAGTSSVLGTKLSTAPSYAGKTDGQYYYVIHNAAQGAGSETYIPAEGTSVYDLMLPFGALDGTVQQGGNYAIVYERKSASVVAVLYSGAGNASFGNASTIQLDGDDVQNIEAKKLYSDSSARKAYEKNGTTVVVGCYTGKAGSNANLDVKTLEAPKLVVKNEAKLHAIVSGNYTKDEQITLYIKGVQSGALASRVEDCKDGDNSFDITIDDITGDGSMRFTNLCGTSAGKQRFTLQGKKKFIEGEDIEVYAMASATAALATPKTSETITTNSLFDRKTEETGATGSTKEITLYIRNLRHLENLGKNISGYNAGRKSGTDENTVTAVQEKSITGFSENEWNQLNGHQDKKIYGMEQSETFAAINVKYPMTYDGQNHEIYGVKVSTQPSAVQKDKDHTDRTAAGIFGFIDQAFNVKNLILRNNQVSGATNAGMLAGEVRADLTVEDVLAYYHEDEYNADHDSEVEVSATNVAGGLIGLVSGGNLNITDSAASVYVKAGEVKNEVLEGGVAGGFIGSTAGSYIGDQASASGGIIQRCYAGGHTKDGAYDTDLDDQKKVKNTGAGRYNVQAGGYAGGFIGMSTTVVEMDAVYATTSVYSSSDSDTQHRSDSFCGSASDTLNIKKDSDAADAKKNYYAIGPHNGTAASSDDIAKATLDTKVSRRQATPYDRKLLLGENETAHSKMDKTSYPLATVYHLISGTDEEKKQLQLPWFIHEQVGDWVVPEIEKGDVVVSNNVRLTVDYTTDDTSDRLLLFTIKGVISNEQLQLALRVKTVNGVMQFEQLIPDNSGWLSAFWNSGKMKVESNGTGFHFKLYLDDVTIPHGHFADFTIRQGKNFILGEDLDITVSECSPANANSIKQEGITITEVLKQRTNSLFDHVDGETAYISNARHLENLDEKISGLNDGSNPSVHITKAVLMNDILWTQPESLDNPDIQKGFVEEIKTTTIDDNYKSTCAVGTYASGPRDEDGYFAPITNSVLTCFDGDHHKIQNLKIRPINTDDGHKGGLFGVIKSGLTAQNLELRNVEVQSESYAYAGTVAGEVQSSASLAISNVYVVGCTVNGGADAGGFIGKADGTATISKSGIENANIQTISNYAGGLIGEAGQSSTVDTVTLTNAEVKGTESTGGVIGIAKNNVTVKKLTTQGSIIKSTNSKAGGVIGEVTNGATEVKVEDTHLKGSTTVNGYEYVGGMIGYANCEAYLKDVEIADGQIKAEFRNSWPDNRSVGGFIGYISGSGTETQGAIMNAVISGALQVEATGGNATDTNNEGGVGGIIGYGNASVGIDGVTLDSKGSISVSSSYERAGGILGYAKGTANIKNIKLQGPVKVTSSKDVGGMMGGSMTATIQNATFRSEVMVTSENATAGGVVGFAGSVSDIQNIIYNGKLTAFGQLASGGVIGETNSNVTLKKIGIIGGSTITSVTKDAGGVIGYAQSATIDAENIKLNGLNSEVLANDDAGGAFGAVQGNNKLTFANVAVSSFIKSYNQNAGGLIGRLNSSGTSNMLEKSYYGGRTITGIYSPITINNNEDPYTSNVTGAKAAGGFIGLIENASGLTIQKCFSTGSVGNSSQSGDDQTAGGFIGSITSKDANMTISSCYSMGEVSGSNPNNGGFIGAHNGGIHFGSDVIYISTFNDLSKNAVGYVDPSGSQYTGAITTVSTNDSIAPSSDNEKAGFTQTYDETLPEQYPYKIWTEDWQDTKNKITYYGDWPSPQINGTLVYYKFEGADKTNSPCTLISSEASFKTIITAAQTDQCQGNLEPDGGFGIILESTVLNVNDASKLYIWADKKDGPFLDDDAHKDYRMKVTKKYFTFSYGGKNYIFARITNDKLPKSHFFAKNMTTGDIYEVNYGVNTVKIETVSR